LPLMRACSQSSVAVVDHTGTVWLSSKQKAIGYGTGTAIGERAG